MINNQNSEEPKEQYSPGGSLLVNHTGEPAEIKDNVFDKKTGRKLSKHICKHFGEPESVFMESIPTGAASMFIIPPTDERPHYKIVTYGLSAHPMNVPNGLEDLQFAELSILLPPDWIIGKEIQEIEDKEEAEKYWWPFRLLKVLTSFPHAFQTWLYFDHTIPNGDPPEPYAINTQFCCALIYCYTTYPDEAMICKISRKKKIFIYNVVPLYLEEMNYKLTKGADALLERFDDLELSDILDINRPNVCEGYKPEN